MLNNRDAFTITPKELVGTVNNKGATTRTVSNTQYCLYTSPSSKPKTSQGVSSYIANISHVTAGGGR